MIILVGDLNARPGTRSECCEIEQIDHTCITRNQPSGERKNWTPEVNTQGKKLFEWCKSFDLQILNGRYRGDYWGNFTHFNKSKGSSTVDLRISLDSLSKHKKNFQVLPQLELTDHCKIVVQIQNAIEEEKCLNQQRNIIRQNYLLDMNGIVTWQRIQYKRWDRPRLGLWLKSAINS